MLPGDAYLVHDSLLAGPYPGAPSRAEAADKLDALIAAGVTCFVDLTEEGEGPGAGLHPYEALARKRGRATARDITHLRLPITDVDIPTPWRMRVILDAIRTALAAGETVYVHCWGGVGRTGTVIGCHLIERGADPAAVLDTLVNLRRDTERARRVSPETGAQRQFVRSWRPRRPSVPDAEPR